jgi:beta-fructofuranosidase
MNDPQGIWQRSDGSFHIGYQCHPQHIQWGNISMCAATSADLVSFQDVNSWQNPKTLWPSEYYDIRGVFDGTIIKKGFEGFPTQIYTSTFPGPLGATAKEMEGTETQSIAYTVDEGRSWIKLAANFNPVISQWPEHNLTGFRDPYVFTSPRLARILGNSSSDQLFMTISGGVHDQGPELYLYRQRELGNVVDWEYLQPVFAQEPTSSWSRYSGSFGIN